MPRRVFLLPQIRGAGRSIAAVAASDWDTAALRTEQPNDQNTGPILQKVETGQHPEWKDILDRSPTYKILRLIKITCCEERHTRAPLIIP
jgi:hypothetical protein